jgi:hypothetical protein
MNCVPDLDFGRAITVPARVWDFLIRMVKIFIRDNFQINATGLTDNAALSSAAVSRSAW